MDQGGDLAVDYRARILRDWNKPKPVSRPGSAKVTVRFTERQAPAPEKGKGEGRP